MVMSLGFLLEDALIGHGATRSGMTSRHHCDYVIQIFGQASESSQV
jgi:hypothetical protein